MKKIITLLMAVTLMFTLAACGQSEAGQQDNAAPIDTGAKGEAEAEDKGDSPSEQEGGEVQTQTADVQDGFLYITGGSFQMGSPEDEAWRSEDETQHSVTVSDFYMAPYEVTQAEYEAITGNNPSNFSGSDLPVENVTWLDAVAFCNGIQ